jgi:hypothetical protein
MRSPVQTESTEAVNCTGFSLRPKFGGQGAILSGRWNRVRNRSPSHDDFDGSAVDSTISGDDTRTVRFVAAMQAAFVRTENRCGAARKRGVPTGTQRHAIDEIQVRLEFCDRDAPIAECLRSRETDSVA